MPIIHQMNIIIPKITPNKVAISTPIPLSNENDRARRSTNKHKQVHRKSKEKFLQARNVAPAMV